MKKYLKFLIISLFVLVPFIAKADSVLLESLQIEENDFSLLVGEDHNFTLSATPAEYTEALVWTSSNESVATIDNNHLVAVGVGTTTITVAGEESGAHDSINITVYNAPTDIEVTGLAYPNISVQKDYPITANILPDNTGYTAEDLEWDVEGPGFIIGTGWCGNLQNTADNQRCLRIFEPGEYTLTVSLRGTEISKSVTFEAKKLMNEIYVEFPSSFYNMSEGEDARATIYLSETNKLPLTVEGYPEDIEQSFTYASSDTSVATVSNDGVVTALKAGTVTITVTSKDGNAKSELIIKVLDEAPIITEMSLLGVGSYQGTNVYMMWNPVDGAKEYKIYRSTSKKGKYKLIKTTNEVWFDDTKLKCGSTYYYKVTAVNSKGSKTSKVYKVKMKPDTIYMVFEDKVKDNSIKMTWYKTYGTGYEIYRSTNKKKGFKKVKTITNIKTVSFTDKKLKANTKYYYKFRVYKKVGGKKIYSSYSQVIEFKTAPAVPKIKVSTNQYDSLKVKVNSVKGATYYEIYRGTKKDKVDEFVTTLNEAGTYTDEYLELGKTYYYKVKACNSNYNCSRYSSVTSKKVALKAPSVTISTLGGGNLDVSVSESKGATYYEIYKSEKKDKGFKLLNSVPSDQRQFLDIGKSGKTYYYKARAYVINNGKKIYSGYGSVTKVKAK